ncbi:MAG TPA: hypothetical protein VHI51_12555 [Ktedonobacterales bacterium]|jgi:hypothetical protein|nr:hypothetical protein [Ktedonobacterales bacterium]
MTTVQAPSTRLSGRWLLAARLAWLLLMALTVAPFVASLPGYLDTVTHPSAQNAALSPDAQALIDASISLTTYAWISFALICLALLVALGMALILAWKRSDDWMALSVSLFIVVYITGNISIPLNGADTNPATLGAVILAVLTSAPALIIIFGVLLLFPTGRFAPRWTWMILVALTLWALVVNALPALWDGALFIGYPIAILTIVACMIYRYRRVSTPAQRQQTKWVVAGLVITLIANQLFWIPTGFTPLGQTLYAPVAYLVYQLLLAFSPITFFIAIQRYRLYDIDAIINRALVYGSLTVALVGVYAACVLGAQKIIAALTGDVGAEPVVIVATTLLVAALFRPLRAGLQALVDRRFYRSKYDAARTIAGFSATLRQETELDALQGRLLETVERTMQPAHASIWLQATPAARTDAPQRL